MKTATPKLERLYEEYRAMQDKHNEIQKQVKQLKASLLKEFGRARKVEMDNGWLERAHVVREVPAQPARVDEYDTIKFHPNV